MSISSFFANNPSVTNVVDLLGIHHSNPLGIAPIWQLLFIFFVVAVMEYFLFHIRWRQKQQYYPVMFAFLGVAVAALYYYCFQGGLPVDKSVGHSMICWFCDHNIVGWGWAVVGIIASTAVLYILLCAVQQTCAQLMMYSNSSLVETKPWKEWKMGVGVAMLSVVLTAVGMLLKSHITTLMFVIGLGLLLLFVVGKMVADTIRTKNPLVGIGVGLVFLIGIIPICIIFTEWIECAFAYVIVAVALFTGSKARKKEAKKK